MTNQQSISYLKNNAISPDALRKMQFYASKLTGRDDIVFSPEQLDWANWCANGRGSAILNAYAGTGKTFTGLIGGLLMGQNITFIVFGKAAGSELQEKLDKLGIHWKTACAKTCHSMGFGALKYSLQNKYIKVDKKKVAKIIETHPDFRDSVLAQTYGNLIAKLVDYAKQRALGVVGSIDDESAWFDIIDHYDVLDREEGAVEHAKAIVKLAIAVLKASNRITDPVDFADQIYLPLLLKCKFWKYNVVIMDEAQDANPARMMLARACLAPGGRFAAMGDDFQAIMGFAGAENDALKQLKRDFSCIEFPLTVTRRCPKKVVEYVHQWVPNYKAHPDAIEGHIEQCKVNDIFTTYRDHLVPGNAMVCRNTAPLIEMAFTCLRNRVACNVEGRDIAEGLIALALRWKKVKTLGALKERLETYLEQERTKLTAKKAEDKLAALEDKVESLLVIINQCQLAKKPDSVNSVITYLNEIFTDTIDPETGKVVKQVFTLCTIHKSKGREWNTVFWLDKDNLCPSPWARQEWMQQQEINLMYVAATRTKNWLIFIIVEPKAKKYG